MDPVVSLWALFAASFLAATVLPGGSEAVLFGVLRFQHELTAKAIAVATIGNTLGGLSSYLLGRVLPQGRPLKGLGALRRYGSPVLLFSWVPIVGDALCVAAGWLRLNAARCALFI